MSNQKLRKENFFKNKRSNTSFQSDIVIDEDGEIAVSFFGPELLHLLKRTVRIEGSRDWYLPSLDMDTFRKEIDSEKKEYENCQLCPKECGFNRVESFHPECGDWTLKVSNYGLSFGDEIELSEGGGSGVIFLNGCPLTCPSCINEEKVRDNRLETDIITFLKMCESLYQRGANNIQILSPTVSLPHLRIILKTLKSLNFPLPIILKSSGHESLSELKKLDGLVDIYLPDYKFFSNPFWEKKSGAARYHEIFTECLEEMHRQTGNIQKDSNGIITAGVMVRHVLNPYISENEKELILNFLDSLNKGIMVSILDNFIVLE